MTPTHDYNYIVFYISLMLHNETERWKDEREGRQTHGQTDTLTGRQVGGKSRRGAEQTDKRIERQADRWTAGQTDKIDVYTIEGHIARERI